ncbi:O-antigen ligase family protein, partial [Endozoicomonas sp. ONNA2]|uniref:O-antigen ligase family protein n=1 Tax=Endozoicomonas sp. ONNA2 TaxID=2828741 RepID=UPI00214887A0
MPNNMFTTPKFMFYLCCLLLILHPLDQLQIVYIGDFPLRFSQIIIVLGCLTLITKSIASQKILKPSFEFSIAVIYLIYAALSLTYTTNFAAGSRQLFIYSSFLLVGTVSILLFKNTKQDYFYLKLIWIIAVFNCFFGIVQFLAFKFFGVTLGILPETTGDHLRSRAYAFFLEPNWFGVYLACLLPYFFFVSKYRSELNISKFQSNIGMFLLFTAIILSQNRAVIASIIFALFINFYFSVFKNQLNKKFFFFVSLGLVLSPFFLFLFIKSDIDIISRLVKSLFDITESAAAGRVVMYVKMLTSFLQEPLHGYGIASWTTLVTGLSVVEDSLIKANITAPNETLRLLAEDGLIGFLLILLIFFSLSKKYLISIKLNID